MLLLGCTFLYRDLRRRRKFTVQGFKSRKMGLMCMKNMRDLRGHSKVSLLGVDSLWGDCTFIPADWGS